MFWVNLKKVHAKYLFRLKKIVFFLPLIFPIIAVTLFYNRFVITYFPYKGFKPRREIVRILDYIVTAAM